MAWEYQYIIYVVALILSVAGGVYGMFLWADRQERKKSKQH